MTSLGFMTSDEQTVIPVDIRKRLGIGAGSKLEWTIEGDRAVVVVKKGSLMDLAGFLANPPTGAGSTIEEMDAAVREAVARHVLGEDDETR